MQRHHATTASIADTSRSQGSEQAVHITHLTHSKPHGNATLLAQIPDMSFDEPDSFLEERAAAGDGRIISQSLAGKLVISGGILLVLAAILPFVAPAKKSDLKSAPGEPAWANAPVPDASLAPPWSGEAPQKAATPIVAAAPTPSIVVQAAPVGSESHAAAAPVTAMTSPSPVAPPRPAQIAASQRGGGNLSRRFAHRPGRRGNESPHGHPRPRWRRPGANRRRPGPAGDLSPAAGRLPTK